MKILAKAVVFQKLLYIYIYSNFYFLASYVVYIIVEITKIIK